MRQATIAVIGLCLIVAGCNDNAAQSSAPQPESSLAVPAKSKEMSEAQVAEESCLIAVANQANIERNKVSTIDVLNSEAGIGISVQVEGATAPWSCQYSRGAVRGVMFTGSDSGGVPPINQGSNAADACRVAVAEEAGVPRSQVSVIDVVTAEAGTGVTLKVSGATVSWSCQFSRGAVRGVAPSSG